MQRRCVLGLDPGERWLGLARAAADTRVAFPLGTVDLAQAAAEDGPVAAIRALLGGDLVEAVVIGVPVRADGAEDAQAARFRRFGERLAAELGAASHAQSERHSSLDTAFAAPPRRRPRGGKARRARRRSPREQQRERRAAHARAAARILQRWLDQQPAAAP